MHKYILATLLFCFVLNTNVISQIYTSFNVGPQTPVHMKKDYMRNWEGGYNIGGEIGYEFHNQLSLSLDIDYNIFSFDKKSEERELNKPSPIIIGRVIDDNATIFSVSIDLRNTPDKRKPLPLIRLYPLMGLGYAIVSPPVIEIKIIKIKPVFPIEYDTLVTRSEATLSSIIYHLGGGVELPTEKINYFFEPQVVIVASTDFESFYPFFTFKFGIRYKL